MGWVPIEKLWGLKRICMCHHWNDCRCYENADAEQERKKTNFKPSNDNSIWNNKARLSYRCENYARECARREKTLHWNQRSHWMGWQCRLHRFISQILNAFALWLRFSCLGCIFVYENRVCTMVSYSEPRQIRNEIKWYNYRFHIFILEQMNWINELMREGEMMGIHSIWPKSYAYLQFHFNNLDPFAKTYLLYFAYQH